MQHSCADNSAEPKIENEVVIRRASLEDAEFITECTLELAEETEDDILDYSRTLEYTKSCFDSPESLSFWIVSFDGKRVAFAHLSTEFDFYSEGCYTKLQSVFVLKEYRGK